MKTKKKPGERAAKAVEKSGEHKAVEALCDEHITVTVYEGSDPMRKYVLVDNHMPGNPVSVTLGDGEDVEECVERLKGMRA